MNLASQNRKVGERMERKQDIGNSIMRMAKLQNRDTINSIKEKSIGIFIAQTEFESKKAVT